jgi:SAM-dependent methyltransferase
VPKRTDRSYLVGVAYADDAGLRARTSLYDHQRPRIDIVAEALALLGPVRDQRVADVGCGNGRYVQALGDAGAVTLACDLSAGMLAALPSRRRAMVADAQHLPVADQSVDAVLLMHMLYHVPDPALAVREARRVLRPNGRVLVCTNGSENLRELNAIWRRLVDEAGASGDPENVELANPLFGPEHARRVLGKVFDTVTERALASTVVVSDPEPLLRHAATTTAARETAGAHPALLDQLRSSVAAVIAREGEFRVATSVAMFLAR